MPHLLRSIDGEIVRRGRVHRRLEFNPLGASELPSWLTATGTVTVESSAASPGYVDMTAVGGSAVVATSFDIDVSYVEEIQITLEGQAIDLESGTGLWIGFDKSGNSNRGCRLQSLNGDQEARIAVLLTGGNTLTLTKAQLRSAGQGPIRKNISFLWRPKEQEAFVLQDDQVVGSTTTATANLGAITPRVVVQHASLTRHLTFQRLIVDVWTN